MVSLTVSRYVAAYPAEQDGVAAGEVAVAVESAGLHGTGEGGLLPTVTASTSYEAGVSNSGNASVPPLKSPARIGGNTFPAVSAW